MIFFVNVMIPHRYDRYQKVHGADPTVENEKQEESLILETNGIVCENAEV